VSQADVLRLSTRLELPLAGLIQDLVIRDTVPMGLSGNFDKIREMGIRTAVKNGFPFNVRLSLKLLDEDYNPVLKPNGQPVFLVDEKPLFTSPSSPAYPGRIDQSTVQQFIEDYTLSKEVVEVILTGKYVVLEAHIETDGNGSKTVGIFDDYKLDVKLGARIVGDIKL
jgi:hypothetical protein